MSTKITKKELTDLITEIKNCFELDPGYIRINRYGAYISSTEKNYNYIENLYKKILNSINSGKITYNVYNDVYLFLQTLRTSLLNYKVQVSFKKQGKIIFVEIGIPENPIENKNTFNNLFPNVQKNYQNQIIRYNLVDLLRKTLIEIRKLRISA